MGAACGKLCRTDVVDAVGVARVERARIPMKLAGEGPDAANR